MDKITTKQEQIGNRFRVTIKQGDKEIVREYDYELTQYGLSTLVFFLIQNKELESEVK